MENRVKVEHYRIPIGYVHTAPIRYYRGSGFGLKGYNCRPDERGGQTFARVDLDGNHYQAWADCSVKDSFSYRIGRKIAVGRLRKRLELIGYTVNGDGFVEAIQ